MNFHYYDLYFLAAVVCCVIAACAMWRSAEHEQNRQAIAREIDRGPDPYLEPMARLRPVNERVGLGVLPQQKYDELESRRLKLVVGMSTRGL